MRILTKKDKLFFGKNKGRTVEDVLRETPGYLRWVNTNVEFCSFPEDLISEIIEKACEADREAYKYNRTSDYDNHPMWDDHRDFGTIIGINGY